MAASAASTALRASFSAVTFAATVVPAFDAYVERRTASISGTTLSRTNLPNMLRVTTSSVSALSMSSTSNALPRS
jgi:hypothetical protein